MSARVAVAGGGLAGITAALDCADAGAEVTLYESTGKLGGLTHSFRRGDLDVDNGQHVFLRCCTAYLGLLHRLGVADQVRLQSRLDIGVRRPGHARTARLTRNGLPAPLQLGNSLVRYAPLAPLDRLRTVWGALALRSLDLTDPALDEQNFGRWLREHGQNDATIEALWDLITVATLNAHADQSSLALAAMVFQTGLFTDATAGDIGWSSVPLSQLHGDAAAKALVDAGVTVRLNAKVDSVQAHGAAWQVGARDGEAVEFDQVVLAVPPPTAERLLPAGAGELPPGWSQRLGSTPIVNVHVVFDRAVLDEPFLAGVGSPVQWVFDRTGQSGLADGQYLAVSLSSATETVELTTAQIREWILPALRKLLPDARGAQVLDFFVTRERHATFTPSPGSGRSRPPAATRLPGLALAGAWTATGWPATMESAVLSGHAAATHLLRDSDGGQWKGSFAA